MPNQVKLWNLRGRVIGVDKTEEVKYMRRGFLRLTPEENMRFDMGTYNPVYDKGSEFRPVYIPEAPPPLDRRNVSPDVLPVEEV